MEQTESFGELLDMSGQHYLIFDTETGGFDITKEAWTSFAGVIVNQDLEIVHGFYTLLNDPKKELTDKALEITGLSREILAESGVPVATAKPIIQAMVDRVEGVIAHNVPFDRKVLEEYGINLSHKKWFDTLQAAWYVWYDPNNYVSCKLGDCCNRVGIDSSGAHNAYDDVIMTVNFLQWLVENNKVKNPLTLLPFSVLDKIEEDGVRCYGYQQMIDKGYVKL